MERQSAAAPQSQVSGGATPPVDEEPPQGDDNTPPLPLGTAEPPDPSVEPGDEPPNNPRFERPRWWWSVPKIIIGAVIVALL